MSMTLNGKNPTYRRSYTLDIWRFGHWEFLAGGSSTADV